MSLKWKIQLWHAAVLALVLGVLSVGFYFYERDHRLDEIDDQLDKEIHPVMGPLTGHVKESQTHGPNHRRRPPFPGGESPRGGPQRGGPPRGAPPRNEPPRGEQPRGKYPLSESLEHPRTDETKAGVRGRREAGGWVPRLIEEGMTPPHEYQGSGDEDIPMNHARFEKERVPKGFYAKVVRIDGRYEPFESSNFPDLDLPTDIGLGYYVRFRGESYRELYHENPTFQVLVGADLTNYYRGLNSLKLKIFGGAFSLFLIGVVVGSIFVSRLIRPLDTIEEVSSKIAKGKLKERIPEVAGGGARELQALAENLNHTFGQLEASFQRQIRFTADASHELRTPLTALLSQIEYGLKRERPPEEYQEILEVCQRSSERIQRITKQLIELSRYDSGKIEMDLEEVALEPLLIALSEELEPYVRAAGHQLHTEIMPGDLVCDPFRLDQVITNLINNAVQHNEQPISLTLRAEMRDEECFIEVIDTGKGIQQENLETIFGRFFQESSSRANGTGRTNVGLGLPISEAIVKAHGGRIEVESAPGVKTIFRIVLQRDARST